MSLVLVVLIGTLLLTGGLLLWLPALSRRGLLFGVYVGEQASGGERALALRAEWTRGMLVGLLLSLGLAVPCLLWLWPDPWLPMLPMLFLVTFAVWLYLRLHRRAREMAVDTPAGAVAVLEQEPGHERLVALVALAVSLLVSAWSAFWVMQAWEQLPPRFPVHFGALGEPDAWAPTTPGRVLLLPLMALFVGGGTALIALLTASAKRGLRMGDAGVSLRAQRRFRRALVLFLSLTSLLLSLMLAVGGVGAVRVALGQAERLPVLFMGSALALLVLSIVGILVIALRYGQGGSRLEREAGEAPLANGLADNNAWKWGMFYVNRDDPSVFVEKRFGIGYTINFGNPKAVIVLVVIIAAMLLPLLLI